MKRPHASLWLWLSLLLTLPFGIRCLAEVRTNKNAIQISGVYPHLTMWNEEKECGTGAVVPWQGRLWAITYAPHEPNGSSDKLYEITPDLEQHIFEGSVGGTPANRMIHRESNQLLIGPYLIDSYRHIRVIPPSRMFGRLTGNARHLFDPKNKVYYATMEEGLYEVDVNTLDVNCLIRDGNGSAPKVGIQTKLPGYHGKGLYSSQGRLLYANNGERHPDVKKDPTIPSGALAQWFGKGDWQLVRRHQFTELTGPGGIHGNSNPESDPVWTMGWDARSVVLGLLQDKEWHFFRLPKGSHSYDGSHGWNTEWPRIREIGEKDFLATMHGTFWRFPSTFSLENSAGIAPRSNYLKVIGDFCRWKDRIVLGCDDSAKAEFYNTRSFKAENGAPLQSNSNLWFVKPSKLDQLGPAIGRGSVWLRDDLAADQVSDPYLFSGYDHRQLHLTHRSDHAVTFDLEIDRNGKGDWRKLRSLPLPARGSASILFDRSEKAEWIRIRARQESKGTTANFQYRNRDMRKPSNGEQFAGIAGSDIPAGRFGLMRSLGHDRLGLVASTDASGKDAAYYELNQRMELVPVDDASAVSQLVSNVNQPAKAYEVDEASVIIVEDGQRWRLPKNSRYQTPAAARPKPDETLADSLRSNLALGAAVKVSSTHASYKADHAADGSLSDESRWIGSKGSTPHEVELDLGSTKTFSSIWVITGWKNGTTTIADRFEVQIKEEGEWKTVPGGSIKGNSSSQREIILKEPVTAQHLRVTSDTSDYFRVYEIALFEKSPDIETSMNGYQMARVCREVATERDLLNVHGTFYELPARNAQGLAKIRPVSTHNLAVHDFCSHNGLLLFTGLDTKTQTDRIFRSKDGKAAVWAGVVDDLWELGKPRGEGGPWKNTQVTANTPSDPYLMTAYDKKSVTLQSDKHTTIRLEVDVDGTGLWIPYKAFDIKAGKKLQHTFPEGYSAYWVRAISEKNATCTVQFKYE